MNWQHFQKNVGMRVQLEPVAFRLDENGNVLPDENDDWIVQSFGPNKCTLRNIRTQHVAVLGKDHIYDFCSNPARAQGGVTFGFLVLKVQVFLQGPRWWLRPNGMPGARVNPSNETDQVRLLRAKLMDDRFALVMKDYDRCGTPVHMIDTFLDPTQDEKAELYDRAIRWKKHRASTNNPYLK